MFWNCIRNGANALNGQVTDRLTNWHPAFLSSSFPFFRHSCTCTAWHEVTSTDQFVCPSFRPSVTTVSSLNAYRSSEHLFSNACVRQTVGKIVTELYENQFKAMVDSFQVIFLSIHLSMYIYISIYLCTYLSIYLSKWLSIHPSLHMSIVIQTRWTFEVIFLSIFLSIYLSIY